MKSTWERPWEKKRTRKRGHLEEQIQREEDEQEEECESQEEVPFVEIDGIKFYSDRFYLHRTSLDPPAPGASRINSHVFDSYNAGCTCGARKAPPLLDRAKLVDSLQLKAAIFATFSLDLSYMVQAYPKLFGPSATVPTLVLHGQKGLAKRLESAAAAADDDDDDDDDSSIDEEYEHRRRHSSSEATMRQEPNTEMSQDFEEDLRQKSVNIIQSGKLGKMVHLTQVFPRYVPIEHQHSPSDGSWRDAKPDIQQQVKSRQGVHHPKYMILFCVDGSVIVLVSTGNMTNPKCTDASWLQRFEPTSTSNESTTNQHERNSKVPKSIRSSNGGDFGAVLTNFLQYQSYAASPNDMLPEEFLKQYMNVSSLHDLEKKFQFEKSQVHLIATVPGEYQGRTQLKHNSKYGSDGTGGRKTFLYGRQRVADIVARLSLSSDKITVKPEANRPWFPKHLLSDKDRLILQPTSMGTEFQRQDLSDVARYYLGLEDMPDHSSCNNNNSGSGNSHKKNCKKQKLTSTSKPTANIWNDQAVLKRVDIIWPTQRLINQIVQCHRKDTRTKSPTSVAELGIATNSDTYQDVLMVEENQPATTPYLFLSSRAFNSLDESCLSRMAMFEPSIPEQRDPLPPHFKSVARLYEGNVDKLFKDKEYKIAKAEEYFSWFLLTSACLSHGAQGRMTDECRNKKGPVKDATLTYSNFELGVMFCSRLQGREATDRLYCWKPSQCHCCYDNEESAKKEPRLIHLPLPYCCRPTHYQIDSEEPDFVETPYFHEIEPGTGAVGHMRLTPYGAAVAAAQNAAE